MWVDEALKLAPNVYETVVEGQPLSEEYILQGRKIVDKRLSLAGARLAHMLKIIFRKRNKAQYTDEM